MALGNPASFSFCPPQWRSVFREIAHQAGYVPTAPENYPSIVPSRKRRTPLPTLAAVFIDKPVNSQSDENKALRRYAELMRSVLRTNYGHVSM